MIDYIRGKVTYLSSQGIVVEQSGIGYQIRCANPFSFQTLLSKETTVYTYQYVREDVIALYGFKTREERELFIRLLGVSGIGPKGGLAVLAAGRPETIVKAIEEENDAYLTKFPGVGKKTARQMILDLKGKFKDSTGLFDLPDEESGGQKIPALDEAMDALKALGYSEKEIHRILPAFRGKDLTAEQYIKEALALMLNG